MQYPSINSTGLQRRWRNSTEKYFRSCTTKSINCTLFCITKPWTLYCKIHRNLTDKPISLYIITSIPLVGEYYYSPTPSIKNSAPFFDHMLSALLLPSLSRIARYPDNGSFTIQYFDGWGKNSRTLSCSLDSSLLLPHLLLFHPCSPSHYFYGEWQAVSFARTAFLPFLL